MNQFLLLLFLIFVGYVVYNYLPSSKSDSFLKPIESIGMKKNDTASVGTSDTTLMQSTGKSGYSFKPVESVGTIKPREDNVRV